MLTWEKIPQPGYKSRLLCHRATTADGRVCEIDRGTCGDRYTIKIDGALYLVDGAPRAFVVLKTAKNLCARLVERAA